MRASAFSIRLTSISLASFVRTDPSETLAASETGESSGDGDGDGDVMVGDGDGDDEDDSDGEDGETSGNSDGEPLPINASPRSNASSHRTCVYVVPTAHHVTISVAPWSRPRYRNPLFVPLPIVDDISLDKRVWPPTHFSRRCANEHTGLRVVMNFSPPVPITPWHECPHLEWGSSRDRSRRTRRFGSIRRRADLARSRRRASSGSSTKAARMINHLLSLESRRDPTATSPDPWTTALRRRNLRYRVAQSANPCPPHVPMGNHGRLGKFGVWPNESAGPPPTAWWRSTSRRDTCCSPALRRSHPAAGDRSAAASTRPPAQRAARSAARACRHRHRWRRGRTRLRSDRRSCPRRPTP